MFEPLSAGAIRRIADIELRALTGRLEKLGATLRLTDAAMDFLVARGYDVQYGARPLKRAIQNYVEDPLCERLLDAGDSQHEWILEKSPNEEKLVFV